jgi:hypothetical protein
VKKPKGWAGGTQLWLEDDVVVVINYLSIWKIIWVGFAPKKLLTNQNK